MTSITEQDYKRANERGNGPKNRMEGGELTDDIEINDPESPLKKKRKKDVVKPIVEMRYKKPE